MATIYDDFRDPDTSALGPETDFGVAPPVSPEASLWAAPPTTTAATPSPVSPMWQPPDVSTMRPGQFFASGPAGTLRGQLVGEPGNRVPDMWGRARPVVGDIAPTPPPPVVLTPEQQARREVYGRFLPSQIKTMAPFQRRELDAKVESRRAEYQAREDMEAHNKQRLAEKVVPAEIAARRARDVETMRQTGLNERWANRDAMRLQGIAALNQGRLDLAAKNYDLDVAMITPKTKAAIEVEQAKGNAHGANIILENAGELKEIEKQYTMQGANQKQAQQAAMEQLKTRLEGELDAAVTVEEAKATAKRIGYLTAQSLERTGEAAEPFKAALKAEQATAEPAPAPVRHISQARLANARIVADMKEEEARAKYGLTHEQYLEAVAIVKAGDKAIASEFAKKYENTVID